MPGPFIAAIHNGELSTAPAANTIEQLMACFPEGTCVEVQNQPAIRDEPDPLALQAWGQRQWELERQWRNHLKRKSRLRDLLGAVGHARWRTKLRSNSFFRSGAWRIREVERLVSKKHQEAWQLFLDSGCSAAIILESDASWTNVADALIPVVLDQAQQVVPVYVNLAGGLSPEDLALTSLKQQSGFSGFAAYSPAVTNTSCAYAINRPMAQLLVDYCTNEPSDRKLGIDWLINACFLHAAEVGEQIHCWHAEPPVLEHGSLVGTTRSWHPDR